MYKLIEGENEYKTGTLYHCYVFAINSLESLYKAYGTTKENAKRRATDFISEIETMQHEGDQL